MEKLKECFYCPSDHLSPSPELPSTDSSFLFIENCFYVSGNCPEIEQIMKSREDDVRETRFLSAATEGRRLGEHLQSFDHRDQALYSKLTTSEEYTTKPMEEAIIGKLGFKIGTPYLYRH